MTATAPELSKSDFFDFVTSNEVTDAQYKKQMRSVNVFMESPDSRSNPLLSEEPKEQNNNSLLSVTATPSNTSTGMAIATTSTALQSFDSIWNVDRDRDRLDTAMLEDLNKYSNYWNQDNELNSGSPCTGSTGISNKVINNTDGQIYTLTVLNHDITETSPNRYWGKEEDVSISSPTEQSSTLDLETILGTNGFLNDFNPDLPKVEGFNYENGDSEIQNSDLITAIVKVEPYNYDDNNEFQAGDKKEGPHSPSVITSPTLLESQIEFNNNNNDWKITDQNTESNESLLRSALQGKGVRYTTLHKNTISKIDGSPELKRIIINNNNKDVPSMYQDGKDPDRELLMAISPQNGNVNISILLEDPNTAIITNGENPSSTQQNVDDILLSHLDANYPDDYEKLKRIASELGESMPPFCTVEPIDPTRSVYNIHHVNGEVVTMIPAGEVQLPQHLQIVTASPTVTSTKTNIKKRRPPAKTPPVPSRTNIQAATSTSNGVRKERSLHYCSICSKGFKDKYSVNVHVRTHTGEKPFSCSLCGKSFRQKAHLAKHYQTHVAQKTAAANGVVKPNKQR